MSAFHTNLRLCQIIFAVAAGSFAQLAHSFEASGSEQQAAAKVNFATDVKPILADNCFFCHGPDADNRQEDLRFDISPSSQPSSTKVIVPGNREQSLLWQRIIDQDDPMPPRDSHKHLTANEVEILGRWIDDGAPYAEHWAYSPIQERTPPNVDKSEWPRGPIDQFLLAKIENNGLTPSPPTLPYRLVRRVYLDLIGVQPTPEKAKEFALDPTDEHYERIVDDLLSDERFGEHWAAWWLDLVRYGDSVGFHGDQPRSVWPYRNWVINALNDDMSFDEFTRLQLAGDLIDRDNESPSQRTQRLFASAYNRLGPVTAEGGAQAREYRAIYAADRVANFGEVWLGSSIGCARCHDHKYDPFTMVDFYSLSAVFEDIDHSIIASPGPNPQWGPYQFFPQNDEQEKKIAEVEQEYNELLNEYPEAGPYQTWTLSRDAGPEPPKGVWAGRLKQLFNQRNELAKTIPVGLITRTLPKPRETRVLPRGNWLDDSGALAMPRAPEFLGGQASEEPFDRLDLAEWLFEEQNPLTARVVVNRLWEKFFGRGISSNTLDLGNQGKPPTHLELLDWLALNLRQNSWSLKYIMRQMVLSEAYRQSSDITPQLAKADGSNRLFARQSATRLSAEVIRDQALFASGLLIQKVGGPSVFPYQPKGHWDALNFPKRSYQQSHGDNLYRRSVYTWVQRTFPHPAMTVFDAPNRESCTASRAVSNTPLQALTLLNETLNVEAARKLAERALLSNSDFESRLNAMFQQVLSRSATNRELDKLLVLFESQLRYFADDPATADAFCRIGESRFDESLSPIDIAAYSSLARVIFNLHETATRP